MIDYCRNHYRIVLYYTIQKLDNPRNFSTAQRTVVKGIFAMAGKIEN